MKTEKYTKLAITVSVLMILSVALAACTAGATSYDVSEYNTAELAMSEEATIYPTMTEHLPMLYISTRWYDRRRTIQGVTNWTVTNADGTATTTMTDSPHPLQIPREDFWPQDGLWSEATISMRTERTEIEFLFDTPPQSVSVVRWNESYVENLGSQEAGEAAGYYEPVESTVSGISIADDGYVYIYQVHATWEEGFSLFAFRVIPLPTTE
jgi:hypothetical protein